MLVDRLLRQAFRKKVVSVIQMAMLGVLRYQRVRDAVLTHPIMSEGVNLLLDALDDALPSQGAVTRGRCAGVLGSRAALLLDQFCGSPRQAIVGAAVFPEGMWGKTEASTTRSPCTPRTRSCGSTSPDLLRSTATQWGIKLPGQSPAGSNHYGAPGGLDGPGPTSFQPVCHGQPLAALSDMFRKAMPSR